MKSGGATDGEGRGLERDDPLGGYGVVPSMTVGGARLAFFLNVRNFAARCDFAITADDAAARESRKTEKSNETHRPSEYRGTSVPERQGWDVRIRKRQFGEQTVYR